MNQLSINSLLSEATRSSRIKFQDHVQILGKNLEKYLIKPKNKDSSLGYVLTIQTHYDRSKM
jgi:hypothetical protein